MSIQLQQGLANEPLDRVLEDLLVRFVVNASPEDLSTNSRVFFLFEEAHWFYLDHARLVNPQLPSMKMRGFSKKLIEVCPIVWNGGDPSEGLKEFVSYKQSIPVRGAALFNSAMTRLLLVQGVESSSWGFPRGKISKDEEDSNCAIREVLEETGLDITPYINKDDYIERTLSGKNYKIFLCRNIPEDYDFQPIVKNEIKSISWMDFKKIGKKIKSSNSNVFFLVNSMYGALNQWVKKNKGEYDETQLKLEVETQLKSMLGIEDEPIKQKTPAVDPGRDLLDIIRKSSATKHLKDIQEKIHEQKQQQSSSQLFPQQGPFPFPVPQPGQFQPFAPIPMHPQQNPLIYNQHGIAVPVFANYQYAPSSQPHQGLMPQQLSQQEHVVYAPNAEQLSRPSLSIMASKNVDHSREVLSILNSDANQSNAKELLLLFNKKKDENANQKESTTRSSGKIASSGYSKALLGLLKTPKQDGQTNEEEESKPEVTNVEKVSSSIASKDLLSLLKGNQSKSRSGTPVSGKSTLGSASSTVGSGSTTNGGQPRPKMKILKRNEEFPVAADTNAPAVKPREKNEGNQDNQDEDENDDDGDEDDDEYDESINVYSQSADARASPKPSKELLRLIKSTQERSKSEEYEVFEEFSDEDFESCYDEEEVGEEEEKETEKNEEFEEIYEQLEESINVVEPYELESEIPSNHERRRSSINDLNREELEIEEPPVIEHFDNPKNLVSVPIQAKKPKKLMMLKRGQELNELLEAEEKKIEEVLPKNNEETESKDSKNNSTFSSEQTQQHLVKDDLLDHSHTGSSINNQTSETHTALDRKSIEASLAEVESNFDHNNTNQLLSPSTTTTATHGSNELLDLLKPSTPQQQDQTQSSKSNPLLDLLHRKEPPQPHSLQPTILSEPQQQSSSQFLLNLLRNGKPSPMAAKSPSSLSQTNEAGNDLLNLLHKPSSPHQEQQHQQQQQEQQNASNELLGLLHKSSSQDPQQKDSSSSASNELLGLLHRPTSSSSSIPSTTQPTYDS